MPEIGDVRYEKVINNGVVSVDRIEVIEVRQNFSIDYLDSRASEIAKEKQDKDAEAAKIAEIKTEAGKLGVSVSADPINP